MAQTTKEPPAFIRYLYGLADREDRARLAELRRGLAGDSRHLLAAAPHVLPLLGPEPKRWDEDAAMLLAALFALHTARTNTGNVGDSMREVWRANAADAGNEGNPSVERRFIALLNAHPEDLPTLLRHAVNLARSHDVPVNWAQLWRDLRYWSHPDGFVQRRWARSFWGGRSTQTEQPTETE